MHPQECNQQNILLFLCYLKIEQLSNLPVQTNSCCVFLITKKGQANDHIHSWILCGVTSKGSVNTPFTPLPTAIKPVHMKGIYTIWLVIHLLQSSFKKGAFFAMKTLTRTTLDCEEPFHIINFLHGIHWTGGCNHLELPTATGKGNIELSPLFLQRCSQCCQSQ